MGASPDIMSLLPPTPEMQPVQVRPAEAPQGNYGIGAGFMGKTGSAAAIAAPLLEGWIAGKQLKEQREQQQAQTKLAGSRNLFAMSVESYRNWVENNPNATPEQKKAKLAAVQQARDAYAGVMEQYVAPPKATTRGGKVKQGVKRALGAPTPELFAQAAVKAFQNQPLEDLVAPDALRKQQLKQAETGTKAEEERLKDLQQQREERDREFKENDEWSALHNKPNRTPEEERRLGELTDKLGKNEEQLAKNDITRKLMSNQKLTPGEDTFARSAGLIQPDQTGMLQDTTGAWYMVKVSADGKVNKTPLGVRGQLPKVQTPGYYESISGLARAYQEATPGMSRQEAMTKAIASFAQAPEEGSFTGAKFYNGLSKAMQQVWNEHKDDPAGQAAMNNFIEKQGKYYFPREYFGDGGPLPSEETGHLWWKKTGRAGMTDDQIKQAEGPVRAQVAEALQDQGFPPEQIDRIMQSWRPISPQLEAPLPGAAPLKKKVFNITGPDGRTKQKEMTDDDAAALRQHNRSLTVSEVGGSPPNTGVTTGQ